MSPAQRRAAIIAATQPLFRSQGLSMTTKQIAEAAGVAEGTIFSVFADKDSLLREAVEHAFDPGPALAQLRAVDPELALDQRLVAAVEIVQAYLAGIGQLMSAPGIGELLSSSGRVKKGRLLKSKTLAAVFEPDREILRTDPLAAGRFLLGLVLATSHPLVIGAQRPPPATEIVTLLLDGIRRRRCPDEPA